MNELVQIYDKLIRHIDHRIVQGHTLPDPVFRYDGRTVVSFSTNNYLGLSCHPRLVAAAQRGLAQYGVGNCESRLLGGDLEIYGQLETKLARLKGKESAVLFATGYLTNLGALSTLAMAPMLARAYGYRADRTCRYAYFTDEFNHLSIREGIRMSGATRVPYRHCDMNSLEGKLKESNAEMKIIVSDGVFSQDGDIAPLPAMLELAERYNAFVYLDDAHATGVLGATGAGTAEHFSLGADTPRLICMGTLSKAYGAIGGFVAADRYLTEIIRFGASAYGFTSTLPPDQVLAVSEAMDLVVAEPQRRTRLWENQRRLVAGIEPLGFTMLARESCIVPVLIGEEELCETYSRRLADHGFHVDSVCFPAVSKGRSRLRFMANANHTPEQIDGVLDALRRIRRDTPGPAADRFVSR